MKMFGALVGIVLVSFCVGNPAWAYSFSPPDIEAHLRQTMIFEDHNDHHRFHCHIDMTIRTGGARTSPTVTSAVFVNPQGQCLQGRLQRLPWKLAATGVGSGALSRFDFAVGAIGEHCKQDTLVFTVDADGHWTFPEGGGNCMGGTARTVPPVTIVP